MAVSTRRERERERQRRRKRKAERLLRPLLDLPHVGRGHPESKRHRLNRVLRLALTPHVARQLWPETASLLFRQGCLKQQQYSAPTPRHDMNRPHRNWHANRPAKTPGSARATCRGFRMPAQAFDQRLSTRSLRTRQRGPHCTFLGSIAASLAVETRRCSPSVENPLLPARAEGTLPWINPCMFHEQRACLLSKQCARFGHYARGQRSRSHDSASVCAG